ncbi:MAG: hypothetical protein ABRQ38_09375 [Candidatus Eremiobacterota bacterium]
MLKYRLISRDRLYCSFPQNISGNTKGYNLLELTIGIAIFFLFMTGIYSSFDVGLKSWQIGNTRSELQQSAEVAMKRLLSELIISTPVSIQMSPDKYIAFESPVNPVEAKFERDESDLGIPLWQNHIIYYVLPEDGDSTKYILYRNFQTRTPSRTPQKILNPELMCLSKGSANIKVLARNLSGVKFEKSGNVINITFKYKKRIASNASVAFSSGGDKNKGIEELEIKNSVEPRN